jgi:heat shock protein HtpX
MIEELIRKNRRKSLYLIVLSFVILLIVGYVLGDVIYTFLMPAQAEHYHSNKAIFAVIFAVFIGMVELVQIFLIFHRKPRSLIKLLDLRPADKQQFAQLNNIIAEMSIASGLSTPPDAYIIPSAALNAVAMGTSAGNGAIAITAGLIGVCNRDELQGVVAHELSHLINRDSQLLEVCRSTLGMVIVLRDVMLRSIYWGSIGKSNYRTSKSSGKGGSGLHLVITIIGVIFAIMAPLMIRLIYFMLSREREYLADAVSAKLTRYPAGLASALTKIALSTHSMNGVDKVTSAAFIEQPYGDVIVTRKGTSTHPPIWNRIRILRKMTGGSGYIDYKRAYEEVMQSKVDFMPDSVAASIISFPVRMGEALASEPQLVTNKEEMKGIEKNIRSEDVVRLADGYKFINCDCGLDIKIPPAYNKPEIKCPRCGRIHAIKDRMQKPTLSMVAADIQEAGVLGILNKDVQKSPLGNIDYSSEPRQVYDRRGKGWEEIDCWCGAKVQLSPSFLGRFVNCQKCKRQIDIVEKAE